MTELCKSSYIRLIIDTYSVIVRDRIYSGNIESILLTLRIALKNVYFYYSKNKSLKIIYSLSCTDCFNHKVSSVSIVENQH